MINKKILEKIDTGKVLNILLIFGLLGGGGYLLYRFVRGTVLDKKAKEADEKAGEPGTAAYFAKQLWLAGPMDALPGLRELYGNDELTLKIACEISRSKVGFKEISNAFSDLTKNEYQLQNYISEYLSEEEFKTFRRRAVDKIQTC